MPSVPCTISGVNVFGKMWPNRIRNGVAPSERIRHDILVFFDREDAGARQPRIGRNRDDRNRQQRVLQAGPQHRHDSNRQQQRWKGQQHVHEAHNHVIDPAPGIAGKQPKSVPTTIAKVTLLKPTTSDTREP